MPFHRRHSRRTWLDHPPCLTPLQVASQQPFVVALQSLAHLRLPLWVSRPLVADHVADVSRGASSTSLCAPHHLKAGCAAAVDPRAAVLNRRDRCGGESCACALYDVAALVHRRHWRSGTSAAVATAHCRSSRPVGRCWPCVCGSSAAAVFRSLPRPVRRRACRVASGRSPAGSGGPPVRARPA